MLSDLKYRLRALMRREQVERELDDELRFHIERAVQKQVESGMTRAQAERRARLEFGGLERIKEETRAVRGVAVLDAVLQDLRYGWRSLKSKPGFAAAVVLTLGLGIGANTAMFGIVDRLLFRAPAFLASAERVHRVYLGQTLEGRPQIERNLSYGRYLDLRENTVAFDAAAAVDYRLLPIGTGEQASELMVAAASASFFDFFDVRPALGRFFSAQEDVIPAGSRVAVLGYDFWQTWYGGRGDLLGEQLHVSTGIYTVIGVAPRGFVGITEGPAPALFIPITTFAYERAPQYAADYGWTWLEMVVRRRPGVTETAATADISGAFVRSWEAQRRLNGWVSPVSEARPYARIGPIQLARGPQASADAKVAAWVMGVAVVVLLIAGANVINLLLARAVHRRREMTLRLALGVTRARLLQQVFTETLLLAVLGGAIGLAIAQWGGRALRVLFLRNEDVGTVAGDARTLLFAAAITLMLALLTGLAPAVPPVRADVAGTLATGMRGGTHRGGALQTGLLLFQAALCVVLLIGAGLFLRSLSNVRALELGYDLESTIALAGNLRGARLSEAEQNGLGDRLLSAATSLPGVLGASLTISVPFSGTEGRGAPFVPGVDSVRRLGRFALQAGSTDFFPTVGTRILRGRGFAAADRAGAQPVVVVNQAMAGALWPNQDPLGKQMRIGNDTMPFLTVVGVAENVRSQQLAGGAEFWYYLPIEQYRQLFGAPFRPALFVRVDGRAEDQVERVRRRLQLAMPGSAYVRAMPLRALVAPQLRSWHFGATMFTAFAGLALALAAIGLYSVAAYAVAQRTRELGVRIALGATVLDVLGLVVRQGILLAAAGITLGSAIALFAGRWVEPLLFTASARDPLVYSAVALMLFVVALAANLRPALRATRVDPTIALRSE